MERASDGPISGPRGRPGRRILARSSAAVTTVVVATTIGVGGAWLGPTSALAADRARPAATPVAVWGQPAPAGTGSLEAVSCGDPRHCWAVGRSAVDALATTTSTSPSSVVIDATTDGGSTWSAESVSVSNPIDLAAVDCPDRRHCMAVGTADDGGPILGAVLVTADGGKAWQAVASPTGSVDLSAVHCFAVADCLVLATDGSTYWSASTTDGGKVWQRGGSLPPGLAGISHVACLDATTCVTVGYVSSTPGQGTGAIAATDDGGATWTAAPVPPGVGVLHGVDCTDGSTCVAVGTKSTTTTDVALAPSQVLVSADRGASWNLTASPMGVGDAFAVSCPPSGGCAAVGTVWTVTNPPTPIGGVVASGAGGLAWQTIRTRYVPVGLTGVDCPTSTSCVAAGNDVVARIALPLPKKTGRTPGTASTTTTSTTTTSTTTTSTTAGGGPTGAPAAG
ncbi:MAG TPA: hypothetical protein VHX40_03250 [Acidimicrobiales bacterium]|nr:hypothetical protein [Acidimicrobiales bacterium]